MINYNIEEIRTPEPCRLCRHFHGRSYGGNYLACAMNPLGPTDGHCPDREQLGPDAPPTASVLPMQSTVDLLSLVSPVAPYHPCPGRGRVRKVR